MIKRLPPSVRALSAAGSPAEASSIDQADSGAAVANTGQTASPEKDNDDQAEVIDWDVARKLIPGGDEAIVALASVFQEECSQLLEEMDAGLASADRSRVRRGAHSLKGAARYFGAQNVIELAEKIEQMGREDRLSDVEIQLADLHDQVKLLLVALKKFVATQS